MVWNEYGSHPTVEPLNDECTQQITRAHYHACARSKLEFVRSWPSLDSTGSFEHVSTVTKTRPASEFTRSANTCGNALRVAATDKAVCARQTAACALAVGTIEWPQLDLGVTFLDDPCCWHTQRRSVLFPWSALASVRQHGRLANVCPHFQARFRWFTVKAVQFKCISWWKKKIPSVMTVRAPEKYRDSELFLTTCVQT